MVTALEAVGALYRSAVCSVLADADAGARAAQRIFGTYGALVNGTRALSRTFCDSDPDDDPSPIPPPFEGGQCLGTTYRVEGTYTASCQFNETLNFRTFVLGPVGGIVSASSGSNDAWFITGTDSGGAPALYNVNTNPGGQGLLIAPTGALSCGAIFPGGVGAAAAVDAPVITSVVAIDGPDDCGNPPIPVPPPGDTPVEGDVIYNIDDSTTVTIPLIGIFAPFYVSVDGRINAPISFSLGGVDFNGELTIAPEFNIELFPINVGGGGGGVDNPDTFPPAPPADDQPVDPAPLEERIIGVIVRSVIGPQATPSGITATDIPNIYVPRLASVSFAIEAGGAAAWTPDIDVKNANCYIPCPAPQGAVDFGVFPQQGVTVTARAVRGIPLTA